MHTYIHNLKIIKTKEIQRNDEIMTYLNKKLSDLYKDYINSDKFQIDEIKSLKRRNFDNEYINRYISIANRFIHILSD